MLQSVTATEYGGDILRSPTMDQERTIPQHGSTTCYDHSVAVTLCSIRLAQKWGWDVDWRSLVRGALLHDYFLYNWREHNRDHKLHGFRGNICRWMIFASSGFKPKSRWAFSMALRAW